MRIVSLLPSATEIICALGLEDQLVGVTHECDWPPSVAALPRVTHTLIPTDASSREIDALVRERVSSNRALYTLDMGVLEQLKPDLLVTQALCDVCAVAEDEVNAAACSLPGQPRVINLEPESLGEVIACIALVADATGASERGTEVIAGLERRVAEVARKTATMTYRPRTMLLEWIDPPFSCGHWSPEIVGIAGGIEVIGRAGERSRQVDWSEVVAAQPEVLMIACCGMSVDRTIEDLPILRSYDGFEELPCVINQRVYVMDGAAYFSRPGPRLVDSLEILANAIHPDVNFLPAGMQAAFSLAAVTSDA